MTDEHIGSRLVALPATLKPKTKQPASLTGRPPRASTPTLIIRPFCPGNASPCDPSFTRSEAASNPRRFTYRLSGSSTLTYSGRPEWLRREAES